MTRIVTHHAAAAGLPEDRRSPHVLRHTFCSHLADAGVPIDVIRELAGHADIRTTTISAAANDDRRENAIGEAARVSPRAWTTAAIGRCQPVMITRLAAESPRA